MTIQLRNRGVDKITLNLVLAHDAILVIDLTLAIAEEERIPQPCSCLRVENESMNK